MPELPDVTIYLEALAPRVTGRRIRRVRIASAFVVRSVEPPIFSIENKTVRGLRRIGKRIVFDLEDELFLVLHLMIAGRLRWEDGAPSGAPKVPARIGLAAFAFEHGTLQLTEAGTKKRAAIHLVRGEEALRAFDRGGLDVFAARPAAFAQRLRERNRTLKRALTDPALFDGIGNAYSDEILHAAGLSPILLTGRLSLPDCARLQKAAQRTLALWIGRLREQFAGRFPGPGEITAFRPGFAVHGRFGQPCPACGTAVQRIRYAENETNYCPRCQTGGKLLADRSLSRLLKKDWPRTIEAWEQG